MARNRQGGGRRKLTDLAHNMVIQKNKMNFFVQKNITGNMCFSICLAHFLNPHCPNQKLIRIAKHIHTDLGYEPQDKIAFHAVSKFETGLDLKIVIFHRSSSGKLEVYTNTDETHQNTVHLYLHDEHYYMIKNLKAFLGYGYVCEHCYQGFNDRSLHYCKFTCNVCNTPQCHMHPKKWMQFEDCARYCRSEFCYELHKQPQSDGLRSRCDLVKYCDRCCRQYRTKWSGDKLLSHTCTLGKCSHCNDILIDEGHHSWLRGSNDQTFQTSKICRLYIYSAQCFMFRFLYIVRVFHKSGIDTKNHTPRMQTRIYVRSSV